MTRRQTAALWRASARGYRAAGRRQEYERAARTAAMIEGRPWKQARRRAVFLAADKAWGPAR